MLNLSFERRVYLEFSYGKNHVTLGLGVGEASTNSANAPLYYFAVNEERQRQTDDNSDLDEGDSVSLPSPTQVAASFQENEETANQLLNDGAEIHKAEEAPGASTSAAESGGNTDVPEPAALPVVVPESSRDSWLEKYLAEASVQIQMRPSDGDDDPSKLGIIKMHCMAREVIHGKLSPDSHTSASLLVYDVYIEATDPSRRVTKATIEFEFSSCAPMLPAPTVNKLAPMNQWSPIPSDQEDVGATTWSKWDKTRGISYLTGHGAARLNGSIFANSYGQCVIARWHLYEDYSIKSGVLSYLRCAMLLEQEVDAGFECSVTLNALSKDDNSKAERSVGSTPEEDPIRFSQGSGPTNNLRPSYDVENLGSVNLEEFVDIRFGVEFVPEGELVR
ncbi:hypothetical protein QBC44DRAFT_286655 [Cladorrhinum sp. PSN332]|nr:hypothetical protein QBC44DRAFT_286655 [Cladorrhinum sp. PSN332]